MNTQEYLNNRIENYLRHEDYNLNELTNKNVEYIVIAYNKANPFNLATIRDFKNIINIMKNENNDHD